MGLFSAKGKKELVAVFDVGSSGVGGALFYKDDTSSPEIIFSVREPIPFEESVDFNNFLNATVKALEEVSKKISLAKLGAPKKIFCVLSSTWYASQTRTVLLEKNTTFIFTAKLADSLIQKEVSSFKENYLKEHGYGGDKVRLIEFKNMKTMLNGYTTLHPLDQKTKKVEMTLFLSVSSEMVIQKIEEAIGRHMHFVDIKFSSFVLASFAVSRDMFVHRDNFLLIDVGGEITDIAMIKGDILRESISFPMGKNFLLREMAKSLQKTPDQVESIISLYNSHHAEKKISDKIDQALIQIKTNWLKKFQEALVGLSNDISIPSTIFLTSDDDVAEWFVDTIKNEEFSQYTLTESKFKVIVINAAMLHGIATFKDLVVRDRFIIIESIYISRFLQ